MDIKAINQRVVEQFRAGGPIEGMHRERLLLLTTTGRVTGEPRTTPMMFVRDADRLFVIASDAGAEKHPRWYENLLQKPQVRVEIGEETYDARASVLEGEDRERTWRFITDHYPFFIDHQAKVERTIPVVELTRS